MTTDMHEAAFEQQAISWWYDWRRYLALQISLRSLHAIGGEPVEAFEAEDSLELQEKVLREQLDAIPHERRRVFDEELKRRRGLVYREMESELQSTGQRKLPDPDEVDRRTLAALDEAAEGTHSDGWGEVPTARGMYDLDVSVLADVPEEGSYRVGGPRKRLAIGMSLITALTAVFAGVLVWMSQPASGSAASAAQLLVAEQPVEPWQPLELTVRGAAGVITYAIGPGGGAAIVARWPLTLCVPGRSLPEGASSATVRSSGPTPLRSYTLGPEAASTDLILRACDGGAELAGRIAQVEPIQPAAPDAPTRVGEHAVTLRALTIRGPAEDVQLPPGQAVVLVHVESSGSPDWAALNPSLRHAAASEPERGSTPVMVDGATVFRYQIPLPTSRLDVAWDLTDPATGQVARWRAVLPPPPTRDAYLRHTVSHVTLEAAADGRGRVQIALAVTNGSDAPLLLQTQDITITSGGQQASINPLPELIQPLAEGETRTVTLSLATGAQPLRVRLGSFAFEVRPAGAEGR
jgi:hypothetical protein